MFKFRNNASLIFVALVVIISACKKHEIVPPPGSSTPVFTAVGTFGTQQIELRAGDANVVMTTESALLNGVDFFKGILGNEEFKLEIGLFGGDVDIQNPPVPTFSNQSAILFGNLSQQSPLYSVKKDSLPNSNFISQIEWEVDGVLQPVLNDLSILNPGKYQVCAHIKFTDNTETTLCNEVIVGFKPNAVFDLEFVLGQDHNLMAWIDPELGVVQSVKWFQNGILVSNLNQLNMYIEDDSHLIQAEVLFTNGVRSLRGVIVDADLTGKNIFDFSKFSDVYPLEWDFKAKLKVIKNNIEYFSHTTPNDESKIVVENVQYFGLNTSGKPVYILKGHLNVNLKSNIAPTIIPLDLDVSFGISLK